METITATYSKDIETMYPTRVCSVCGTNELGYTGSYYARDEFWLCPECLKRLKKLLDKENKE